MGVEFRSIDGSGNNQMEPGWGMAYTALLRSLEPAYADGISEPRGGLSSSLPSARLVSETLSKQTTSVPNALRFTDWFWQWGQFVDHDIDQTGPANPAEPFNVPVPMGDPYFDPDGTGDKEIPLNRSAYDSGTGMDTANPRQQINQITAYIDGSSVYGSDSTRASELREYDGRGKLKTSFADNGEVLLSRNTAGLPNDRGIGPDMFLAGDERANEQVALTSVHTLFLREHNRIAEDIAGRIDDGDFEIVALLSAYKSQGHNRTDDDFIYESARKAVGAEIQAITYNEYIPLLLGSDGLSPYAGYDASVNPGIANVFSTAAYRHGHTLLSAHLYRFDDDGNDAGKVPLRDAFFNPDIITAGGVDSLLNGLTYQMAQELDRFVIDDVRNFLFGVPDMGGFDLVSLNIQRGRDHGIPSLNETRRGIGLAPYISYEELASGDMALVDLLEQAYGVSGIDDVDLWIGGLLEVHVADGMLGETFGWIASDQFARLRDGDRFFYLGEEEQAFLTSILPDINEMRLSDVIRMNTSISSIPDDVFLYTRYVPVPGTGLLLFAGALAGLGRRRRSKQSLLQYRLLRLSAFPQ